jgi:CTP synthase
MEFIELKDHPWFVGVQFHPKSSSRVLEPSMPYLGFVAAASGCLDKVTVDLARVDGVNGIIDGSLVNDLNGVGI